MLKAEIAGRLREALAAAAAAEGWAEPGSRPIVLERPREAAHGDLSCNVAMRWARELGRPPLAVAGAIARALAPVPPIAEVAVAGQGFLNLRLDDDALWRALHASPAETAQTASAVPPLGPGPIGARRAEAVASALESLGAGAEAPILGATRLIGAPSEAVLEQLGDGALRFWLLGRSPDAPLTLDWALMRRESAENPAFLVQHALVRLTDVLTVAAAQGLRPEAGGGPEALASAPARALLLIALLAEDEIATASRLADPSRVVRHALALAEAFHRVYVEGRVFGVEASVASARLALLERARRSLERLLRAASIVLPPTF